MNFLKRGRKKVFGSRILLPLTDAMLEEIDARLERPETRVDFIRRAIEAKLAQAADVTETVEQIADYMDSMRHIRASITRNSNGLFHYICKLHYWGDDVPTMTGIAPTLKEARKEILAIAAGYDIWADVVVCCEFIHPASSDDPAVSRCHAYLAYGGYDFKHVEEGSASEAKEVLKRAIGIRIRENGVQQAEAKQREKQHAEAFNF
ncbi:hypothetical protein OIU34_23665 [Pararhizobium sp. BT-229]|uniref:hypothetical protein n=1 Tax=Pararhizobium sp. BT-229 TaxID=2986923 RepID=UPI0021F7E851|nr:hypothetical protein [Pararhizobium sp. BT-229]MCV9964895.1 hypothetical protein [Pararhizobium sp. BT-229]